ncbi:kinase-like domain-containing protein [Gautieria morchelliformis]|nr:kinase-like domain-containing protein [Gautieria morchelliformis]
MSETERKAIEACNHVLPQCLGCGVVYPFLKSKLCGKCNEDAEKEPQLFSGCDDVMNHILKRTAEHEGSASDHRLNRRSQNPSLKKGSEILKKTQALRKLSKMDSIGIKLTIWYYPAVRSKGGCKPRQIQIPAVVEGFTATTLATEMIDRLLEHAEKVYDKAAIADKPTPKPFFLRDKVVFAVAKTVHESSYLDIDEPNLFCTVQALHEKLEKDSLLSDKDIKAWGKFFLDSFIRRAQQYGAKNIPEMKWNADGAFLGTLVDKLPDLPAEQRSNQSLIWNIFLAVPLLEPGATERRFSGNGDTSENSDYLGIWINAFAHHTVVYSMGEYVFVDIQGFVYSENRVVLFDPQAHIFDGSSGFWDKGRSGILQFLKEHKCNKICRKLGLNTEVVVVPAPLNDIAVPQMEVLPTIKPRNLHRQWEL